MKEFMTPRDLAALLPYSYEGILDMIQRGALPAIKIGQRILVRRETIENLAQTHPHPAKATKRHSREKRRARKLG